jgi:hypothetical protein
MLIEPKAAYFHMVAWFLLLVLTIIIMAINRVDASSLLVSPMLIEPKAAYFHMVAWFLPLALTIIIMAINRVDASSLYGKHYVDRA